MAEKEECNKGSQDYNKRTHKKYKLLFDEIYPFTFTNCVLARSCNW